MYHTTRILGIIFQHIFRINNMCDKSLKLFFIAAQSALSYAGACIPYADFICWIKLMNEKKMSVSLLTSLSSDIGPVLRGSAERYAI